MKTALVLAAGLALIAAACGDDESSDTVATTEAPEPVTTEPAATEPPATDPPATEPPPTDPPPTEPPETSTTTTQPPPPPVDAVGLVPLPGEQRDFSGQLVANPSLVWSMYSGSGGIIVENIGGPLPPGCHGTSMFDPETFDLIQIEGRDLEAYATRGEGGCGGMQQEVGEGVVDGDAVVINDDELILFDFGALPGDPFDVSTQILDPDGQDGVFRSADPLVPRFDNQLDDPDLTHVIGADVLFEVAGGELELVEPPLPEPGDCIEFEFCLFDRFGVDVIRTVDDAPGQVMVAGERSGLFTFLDETEWQALVRIVNGCQINDHFWVFAAATSGVEFDLTVTDTTTGESRSYLNPLDNLPEPITDTAAFATCP